MRAIITLPIQDRGGIKPPLHSQFHTLAGFWDALASAILATSIYLS